MTKTKKNRLAIKREKGTESILNLQEEGYLVYRMSPYQWRINDRLDLFPTNRRYHDTFTNERGNWEGAFDICRKIFKGDSFHE